MFILIKTTPSINNSAPLSTEKLGNRVHPTLNKLGITFTNRFINTLKNNKKADTRLPSIGFIFY